MKHGFDYYVKDGKIYEDTIEQVEEEEEEDETSVLNDVLDYLKDFPSPPMDLIERIESLLNIEW